MVGLSIVLEAKKGSSSSLNKRSPQVINKFTMKPTQTSSLFSTSFHSSFNSLTLNPAFLDKCFLCRKKLLPAKDIFMYKGDKGFCSEECRCRQIDMDEEDQSGAAFMSSKKNTYKVKKTANCSSYYSSSASKTTRNRAFEFAG